MMIGGEAVGTTPSSSGASPSKVTVISVPSVHGMRHHHHPLDDDERFSRPYPPRRRPSYESIIALVEGCFFDLQGWIGGMYCDERIQLVAPVAHNVYIHVLARGSSHQ